MKYSEKLKNVGVKTLDYIKLAKIELIVLASVLLLDLIVKAIVAGTMTTGQSITVIPKFFNITFYLNKKAAFGFDFGLSKLFGLEATRIIFIVITFLAVGLFCFLLYYFRKESMIGRLGLALIISGALGNLYDRIFIGAVRDFAEIVFFGLDIPLLGTSFAIFNIADMALVAGVIMFIVFFLFLYKPKPKEKVEVVGNKDGNINSTGSDNLDTTQGINTEVDTTQDVNTEKTADTTQGINTEKTTDTTQGINTEKTAETAQDGGLDAKTDGN